MFERKKEEKIHFERDKKGRITNVIRTDNYKKEERKMKEEHKLLQRMQKKKGVPEQKKSNREKQVMNKKIREFEKKQAMERARKRAKKWDAVKEAGKKTSEASRETMQLSKIGFSSTKKKPGKPVGKQQYIIKGGVAYPVADRQHKKKKKKKEGDFNMKDFGMPSWKDLMK